jgi:hypothetical protein
MLIGAAMTAPTLAAVVASTSLDPFRGGSGGENVQMASTS